MSNDCPSTSNVLGECHCTLKLFHWGLHACDDRSKHNAVIRHEWGDGVQARATLARAGLSPTESAHQDCRVCNGTGFIGAESNPGRRYCPGDHTGSTEAER